MKKLNQAGEVLGAIITILFLGLVVVGIIAFVSWNNNHQTSRGRGDATVGQVNNEPRDVYQMPDAFSNVAEVCDKYGNLVVVTTKTDSSRAIWAIKDGCTK